MEFGDVMEKNREYGPGIYVIDDSKMPSPEDVASYSEYTEEEKQRLKALDEKLDFLGL